MTTTENSRADALTDGQRAAIKAGAAALRKLGGFDCLVDELDNILAAPPVDDNQIQVTHTIATEANAATILHGLLDSFVEVAVGFPSAVIDERLAGQVRIYLPAPSPADERDKG